MCQCECAEYVVDAKMQIIFSRSLDQGDNNGVARSIRHQLLVKLFCVQVRSHQQITQNIIPHRKDQGYFCALYIRKYIRTLPMDPIVQSSELISKDDGYWFYSA